MRIEDAKLLTEVSSVINSSLELDKVLEFSLHAAERVTGGAAASVILIDEAADELVFEVATGEKGKILRGMRFPRGKGVAGWVAEKGKPTIVNDVQVDDRFLKEIDEISKFKTKSLLCMPLLAKGKTIGAVEVVNKRSGGVFDEKDIEVLQSLSNLVAVAIENARLYGQLRMENRALKKQLGTEEPLIGSSPPMLELRKLIGKVADEPVTVLIRGDTGTGKEVIAREIHRRSHCANGPFVGVNCSALPESLMESELFGHERGAFTGALAQSPGRFELADKGTIFLDEVGEIPHNVQVKLLRVLQEREFERVGGKKRIRIDVRLIAATSRDLEKAMQEGQFRDDLFYRLNVVPMFIPPLRERKSDIPALVEFFLSKYSSELNKKPKTVSEDAMRILMEYEWPGNVRELENIIERILVINDDDELLPDALPAEIRNHVEQDREAVAPDKRESAGGLNDSLGEVERGMVIEALKSCDWNQTRAAEKLGISRDCLRYRVKKYKIKRP